MTENQFEAIHTHVAMLPDGQNATLSFETDKGPVTLQLQRSVLVDLVAQGTHALDEVPPAYPPQLTS